MQRSSARFDLTEGPLTVVVTTDRNECEYELSLLEGNSTTVQSWRARLAEQGRNAHLLPGDARDHARRILRLRATTLGQEPERRYSITMSLHQSGRVVGSVHEQGFTTSASEDVDLVLDLSEARRTPPPPPRMERSDEGKMGKSDVKHSVAEYAIRGPSAEAAPAPPAARTAARAPLPMKKNGGRKGAKKRARGVKKAKKLVRKAKAPPRKTKGRKTTLAKAEVRREPHIDFHEWVRAGEANTLTFRLTDILGPVAAGRVVSVVIPGGKQSVRGRVLVGAPGFDVVPSDGQAITIGRDFEAASEQVSFQLTAHDPGKKPVVREIQADLWVGTGCLGGARHFTEVIPKAYKGTIKGDGRGFASPFAPFQDRKDCDLAIIVSGVRVKGKPPYHIVFTSRVRGATYDSRDFGELTIPHKEVMAYMQGFLGKVIQKYKGAKGAESTAQYRQDMLDALEDLGRNLWTEFSDDFRDEYFRLQGLKKAPLTIQISSDEMVIPWELIVPHRGGKSYPALGAAHVMGRWPRGFDKRPSDQRLTVDRGIVLNPKYGGNKDLPWSIEEANELKTLLAPSVTGPPQVSTASLRALLKRNDVQLVHFTGHGKYNVKNPDQSELELPAQQTFAATGFTGTRLLSRGPMLYLNACETGMSGAFVGRMGGFAERIIAAGGSGIIAPYWSVTDASAKAFALAFYTRIAAGTPIGEALRDLRAENPKNPTFQAFTYFGDPFTLAEFSTAAAAPARRRVG